MNEETKPEQETPKSHEKANKQEHADQPYRKKSRPPDYISWVMSGIPDRLNRRRERDAAKNREGRKSAVDEAIDELVKLADEAPDFGQDTEDTEFQIDKPE